MFKEWYGPQMSFFAVFLPQMPAAHRLMRRHCRCCIANARRQQAAHFRERGWGNGPFACNNLFYTDRHSVQEFMAAKENVRLISWTQKK
jgi:type II secretory ATPase GspE/PulE/Tfp pilus assembly ATPase PilB-like protein